MARLRRRLGRPNYGRFRDDFKPWRRTPDSETPPKANLLDGLALMKVGAGEFAPRTFRGPPDDIAAAKNEAAQRDPAIRAKRNDAKSDDETGTIMAK
jgi:hypothetical protein